MIWAQAMACFAVWIAYGWTLRRRSDAIRARFWNAPRRTIVVYGSVGLIASAAMLLAGLAGIAAMGGMAENGLRGWAWAAVTVLGLAFVHLQAMGAAAILCLVQREAAAAARASESRPTPPAES